MDDDFVLWLSKGYDNCKTVMNIISTWNGASSMGNNSVWMNQYPRFTRGFKSFHEVVICKALMMLSNDLSMNLEKENDRRRIVGASRRGAEKNSTNLCAHTEWASKFREGGLSVYSVRRTCYLLKVEMTFLKMIRVSKYDWVDELPILILNEISTKKD